MAAPDQTHVILRTNVSANKQVIVENRQIPGSYRWHGRARSCVVVGFLGIKASCDKNTDASIALSLSLPAFHLHNTPQGGLIIVNRPGWCVES